MGELGAFQSNPVTHAYSIIQLNHHERLKLEQKLKRGEANYNLGEKNYLQSFFLPNISSKVSSYISFMPPTLFVLPVSYNK